MRRYSAILFLVTLSLGSIEIACGLKGEPVAQIIPCDVFGGLVLLTISAVFLRGIVLKDCEPFFYFGSMMLVIFGILYLLVLIANGLDAMITGESWNPMNGLRIEILLVPLAIPGLASLIKAKRDLPP